MLTALITALSVTAAPAAGPAVVTDRDVAPLHASGALARARDDFQDGRYAAAARGFARAKTPEARWMEAQSLAMDGRHAETVPLLRGLAAELPDLADRIELRLGRGLDAAGQRAEAAAAYGRVPEWSLGWGEAVLARARALEATGQADEALGALVPLLALKPPGRSTPEAGAEALLLAGRIRAKAGDPAFARRAWLECWAGTPLAPAAADCADALRTLPGAEGAPPEPEDRVRRAEALLDANRSGPAMAELRQAKAGLTPAAPATPLACRASFAMGKALRRDRQHASAMAELAPVVERCTTDADLRVRALYVLASASSIASPDDGLARYQQLAREYPSHPFADDALFYAADLHGLAGRLPVGRRALLDLADRYPAGDFRAEALFRAAWISSKLGERDAAIEAYARIEDLLASDPYESSRAAYWRARLLAERAAEGDAERAAATWAGLVDRQPADYYGLLARARLAEAKAGLQAAGPQPLRTKRAAAAPSKAEPRRPGAFRYAAGGLPADRHFRAGVLLLRLGLHEAAAAELGAVSRSLLEGDDPEPLLLVAELLDRAGDHRTAHTLVRTAGRAALRGRPDGDAERIWRIAYPPAFRSDVERWATRGGVEPDLLQAIMREESALDPRVVSAAGAVGLTQLMLPTAQESARKLKVRVPRSASELMDPSLNIRLGAHHLGTLLKRFDGSAPLAIAAYNVGAAPVRRWLSQRGELPLDAFVEEIPVQETRGYVKRVLRSYAAYRLLLGARASDPLALRQTLPPVP